MLSTDTGLAVNTAEHFYTCYHEAIYVSIEEANGYTTIFDIWTDYNFHYVKIKLLKRNPQVSNQTIVFEVEASKIKIRKKKY